MKLKIFIPIFFVLVLVASALGLPVDYFIKDTIDISAHLTNPQALEVIPGGFVVIDWESDASTFGYILDREGKLRNATNAGAISKVNLSSDNVGSRITSIRTYTTVNNQINYIILDDTNKSVFLLNASSLSFDNRTFRETSTWGSSDDLVGLCTDKSSIWVAVANRDVINKLAGTNGTINQSGEYPIPETNNAGGFDCFDGDNKPTIILDDTTGIVFITSNATRGFDFVNISDLTGKGLNTFTDIALLTDPAIHRPDFYALNNDSKLIYHFMKRPPSVLNIFDPDITWIYPARNQVFNTRFSSKDISFNFTVLQPNSSRSEWTDADVMNCTIFINETYNITTLIQDNNVSVIHEINVSSFSPGFYKIGLDCLANISYAKTTSDFRLLTVNTYKHIIWMGDNFTLYYDSDALAFKAAMGNSTTELSAAFNITTDEPVAIRIVWNNVTGNRSIYINGILKASDLSYEWHTNRLDRIYFLSRNDTGQANAVLSYVQTSLVSTGSSYSVGTFITSWKSTIQNLVDRFSLSSYFYQFKAVLRRGLSSEKPVLRFVNITFDDTLMNFTIEPNVNYLDFSFSSGTSYALPVGQTADGPIFTIWNIGNKSFSLQALSLTPFDSCFTVGLFNISDAANYQLLLGGMNNTINLSTSPQNITKILGPGKKASIWINVSASSCGAYSEFFDIEFITWP